MDQGFFTVPATSSVPSGIVSAPILPPAALVRTASFATVSVPLLPSVIVPALLDSPLLRVRAAALPEETVSVPLAPTVRASATIVPLASVREPAVALGFVVVGSIVIVVATTSTFSTLLVMVRALAEVPATTVRAPKSTVGLTVF